MEGHARNDTYPGYGELARAYEERRERYDEEAEALADRLQEERDRGVEGIDNEKLKLVNQLQRAPRLLSEVQGLEQRYVNAVRALNGDYQALVEEYRQANRGSRSTPAPACFNVTPALHVVPVVKVDMPSLDGIDGPHVIEMMGAFSRRLHREFDRLVTEVGSSATVIDGRDPLAIAGGS